MKKYFLMTLLIGHLAIVTKVFSQNIAVNGTGSLPDTSAMLDVASTTKGFLAPRMTTTQQNAIPLPAAGLLIFNTITTTFNVNIGTPAAPVWTSLLSNAGSAWTTIGNTGVNYATHFLGSTNNASLRFRTNNTQKMILDSIGNLGIGSANPTKTLEVVGDMTTGLLLIKNTNAAGYSSMDFADKLGTVIGNVGYANTSGSYGNSFYFATNTTANMVFATNNSEKMRIDGSTGYIGIGNTSPNSSLHITGSLATAVTSVSANTTLSAANSLVLVNNGSTAKTITLPPAADCTGRVYTIKKTDTGTGIVTIDGNSSEKIDGATTYTIINSQYESVTIQSDGSNWFIIAKI